MPRISAVLIVYNESHSLPATLGKLQWCDEIVVVDSGSTDHTVDICLSYGCKVLQREFDGYASQKQYAVDQASNNWVLSIDADEVLSDGLVEEIKQVFAKESLEVAGFYIPRRTWFMGKMLRFSGTRHEKLIRAFDRTKGKFTSSAVHETIVVIGKLSAFRHPMIHYTYSDIADHVSKTNKYTSLAAQDYFKLHKRSSKWMVIMQFPFKFLIVFLWKGGFMDGYQGFMFAFMHAVSSTIKYAKLLEMKKG
jgi:glycosyltransferase involved in cell wall biosynthesis